MQKIIIFLSSEKEFELSIKILNSTFLHNRVRKQEYTEGALSVVLSNSQSTVFISNCNFLHNVDGAIGVRVTPRVSESNCSEQPITLHNLLVYNTTTYDNNNAAEASVSIITEHSDNTVVIREVKFESNNYNRLGGGMLLVLLYHVCENKNTGYSMSLIELESCTFVNNIAVNTLSHFQIGEIGDIKSNYLFNITNTVIDHNM